MNDDTIYRQTVLDLLVRCAVPENGVSLLYQGIKQLPSAERHGRWIRKAYDDNSCSLCGWNVWVNTGNYCPNCGAKMDGNENE